MFGNTDTNSAAPHNVKGNERAISVKWDLVSLAEASSLASVSQLIVSADRVAG